MTRRAIVAKAERCPQAGLRVPSRRSDADRRLAAGGSGVLSGSPINVVGPQQKLDEALARLINLLIAQAAYETAAGINPRDLIEYRHGTLVIANSSSVSRSTRAAGAATT